MALNLQTWNGSTWDTVDLTAQGIADFKLVVGYQGPQRLTFTVRQAHHLTPIDPYTYIRFWDDAGSDPSATPWSSSNPTFLGRVEDVDPGDDGQSIDYTCLDPTVAAANTTQIMSTAWTDATTEGLGAVPRLVFNSTIDNDDDWQFCRAYNLEVGEMIATILDDARPRLVACFAAPAGGGDAYDSDDLDLMDYEPQEKIVFMSEPISGGLTRMIGQWEPEFRLYFHPTDRTWRFFDITQATQVTRTLNDFTETYPIIQLRLQRSLEGRYTAVKIYGPEAVENRTITLSGGGLTDVSDGPLLDEFGAGGQVFGKNKWQIVDTTRRRMGKLLPTEIVVEFPAFKLDAGILYSAQKTKSPAFEAIFGNEVWECIVGWTYDPTTGIVDFGDTYIYNYREDPPIVGGILQPNYENPSNVRLQYPSYIDPLSARAPETSFEGTAYTEYGLENEWKIYDESLAVGYLYGTPVTSATRIAAFEVLARKILDTKKDVVHTGQIVLDGIDYEWSRLNRRLNLDGVDGSGSPKTTGWESMNAWVTEVEYDYEEQLTTITLSSDQMDLLGLDQERIKSDLKIGAATIQQLVRTDVNISTRRGRTLGGTQATLGQDISVNRTVQDVIFDPFVGYEAPIFQT